MPPFVNKKDTAHQLAPSGSYAIYPRQTFC